MDAIIAALVSGIVTLAGVLIANGKSQAVTDVKIEELTREVRKHNSFAEKNPRHRGANQSRKSSH